MFESLDKAFVAKKIWNIKWSSNSHKKVLKFRMLNSNFFSCKPVVSQLSRYLKCLNMKLCFNSQNRLFPLDIKPNYAKSSSFLTVFYVYNNDRFYNASHCISCHKSQQTPNLDGLHTHRVLIVFFKAFYHSLSYDRQKPICCFISFLYTNFSHFVLVFPHKLLLPNRWKPSRIPFSLFLSNHTSKKNLNFFLFSLLSLTFMLEMSGRAF